MRLLGKLGAVQRERENGRIRDRLEMLATSNLVLKQALIVREVLGVRKISYSQTPLELIHFVHRPYNR
jgi:hypothetical protein